MKIEYEAEFSIDVGQAIQGVGDLMEEINSHLSTMGCNERVKAEATIVTMIVSVDRPLTKEEENKIKEILEITMRERIPQYDIRLASFGRKSGNVVQSVS